ncbi:MAG: carboxypeptidase-like regulatory domain-containing protein [Planctomycetaceae bacterium]|nr:carboxypeptidase-like regulatory domain-containing protein [Planctomycetaceae bacterium]
MSQNYFHYPVFVAQLCLVVFLLSGCNPATKKAPMNYVEGIITLDGEPVSGASIRFTPKEASNGISAAGFSDKNGKYKLTSMTGDSGKGTLPGEYLVTVTKYEFTDLAKPKFDAGSHTESITQESKNILPEIYRFPKTTPLTVTVKQGKNNIDIPLKK